MKMYVDEQIRIELINAEHARAIFDMVDRNRIYLRTWLPFVDNMQSLVHAERFTKGCVQRNQDGSEFAFVIVELERPIGRVGVYRIDDRNRTGEIGYWLIEDRQGKGIVSRSCKVLIDFCFNSLQLNRLEIKCGTGNLRSRSVPERLNFTHEGVIRQGELLNGEFIDLNLYSLLRSDRK